MKYILVSIFIFWGCKSSNEGTLSDVQNKHNSDNSERSFDSVDDSLDKLLGEQYEGGSKANEDKLINKLAIMSVDSMKKRFPVGPGKVVPRDVHGKSHGCLFGYLKTNNELLPKDLRVGVFKENSTKSIVMRYSSNDKSETFKDFREDIRGLGLKVMNVNGVEGQSQDFLFLGAEEFFIKDNAFYVDFLEVLLNNSKAWAGMWLAWNDLKGAIDVGTDMVRNALFYSNPLEIPFFSAVPYRLGKVLDEDGGSNAQRRAVKYRIQERDCDGSSAKSLSLTSKKAVKKVLDLPPKTLMEKDFLRKNLQQEIGSSKACLTFSIQIRDPADKLKYPVEDSTISWKNQYMDVAEIVIFPQTFDEPGMRSFCENLSFSPWNTLDEHKPLGRINRARKAIYEATKKYRHSMNGVDNYREPTDFTMRLD